MPTIPLLFDLNKSTQLSIFAYEWCMFHLNTKRIMLMLTETGVIFALTGGTYPQPSSQPYRPSNMCERAQTDCFDHVSVRPQQAASPCYVNWVVSRLHTPIGRNSRNTTQKSDKSRRLPNRSTLGPEEKLEWIERIQKPTTSCAYRKCCALVADPDLRKYRHRRFSQNIVVSPARLDEILVRVCASTASTCKNYEQCRKLDCNANRYTQKNNLALVSGLSRSH